MRKNLVDCNTVTRGDKVAILIALLLLAAAAGAAAGETGGQRNWYSLAVAPVEDPAALIDNPEVIYHEVKPGPEGSGVQVVSTIDVHALYDVPVAEVAAVLTDLNDYPSFSPRVTESSARQFSGNPKQWIQKIKLSFRVLFFGEDYEYTLRVTSRPGNDPGSVAFYFALENSLDGKLSDVAGSWYLVPMTVGHTEYTYVRYFNHIEFSKQSFGLKAALRLFGASDMASAMTAFVDEAKRREAK